MSWEQLDYDNNDLLNLHYGLIHVGLPTLVNIEQHNLPSVKSEFKPKNYTLCKSGDIAFADASEDTNEVAKPIEFYDCSDKQVVCGLHTIHGRDKLNATEIGFKGYAFSSTPFHHKIRRLAQGSKIYSISSKNFSEVTIGIPTKEEQRKIVDLLSKIDERITTQNKIIEDLKKLKVAICNKYLNKGEQSVKLGEIGSFIRGLTYSSNDINENQCGTIVLRSNNIVNGESVNLDDIIWVNKTPSTEQVLRDGDIVICMANGSSSLVGKSSYYSKEKEMPTTVGTFCGIFRPNHSAAKWLFQTTHYKQSINKCLQGGNGAIANVYPEDILSISFNIPSNIKLVIEALEILESKIIQEQKYQNRYTTLKSYLLQQMFI